MEIYLDNSATTRCFPEAAKLMYKVLIEDYGNPSSLHQKGVDAEKYVREAKEIIAKNLKVEPKEIYFTSGGTESDNLALMGAAHANQRAGKHLITTRIEHPAILNTMKELEKQGFQVTYLPVDGQGRVQIADLEEALTDETILVSVMYVNNEIGSVQPVEGIAAMIHEKNPRALYHVDAIQAFGKFQIYPKRQGIDLMSVSAHKFHGPKGVGFLYISGKAKVQPQILGGGQQGGMRSGTDNVPGIAGMEVAAREVYSRLEENRQYMYSLKEHMTEELLNMEQVVVNGMPCKKGAPHIISASFLGVRSEVLLHALEERGIYVSAGSACSTHKKTSSSTLTAVGMKKSQLETTLRFSFCETTTAEEIDYCIQTLKELLPVLRRYSRR